MNEKKTFFICWLGRKTNAFVTYDNLTKKPFEKMFYQKVFLRFCVKEKAVMYILRKWYQDKDMILRYDRKPDSK